jgi:hypothetical protein
MKGSSKDFIEIITILLTGESSSEPELYNNKCFLGVFFLFQLQGQRDINVYFGRSEEVTTVCFPSPLFYQYYIQ